MTRFELPIKNFLVAGLLALCSLYVFERWLGLFSNDVSYFLVRKLRVFLALSGESSSVLKSTFMALVSIFMGLYQYLSVLLVGLVIRRSFKETKERIITVSFYFFIYFSFFREWRNYFRQPDIGIYIGDIFAIAIILFIGIICVLARNNVSIEPKTSNQEMKADEI